MKKIFLLVYFIESFIFVKAQYIPIPMSNCSWMTIRNGIDIHGECYTKYSFYVPQNNFDTTIAPYTYSKLYINIFETNTNHYYGAYRQDTTAKKIYFICKDSTNEHLLYDFSVNPGDTVNVLIPDVSANDRVFIKLVVDSTYLHNGRKHIDLRMSGYSNQGAYYPHYQWAEGIGSLTGFNVNTFHHSSMSSFDALQCFSKNDTVFYSYNYCIIHWPANYDTLPNQTCLPFSNVSIDDISNHAHTFEVYPNPSQDYFIIYQTYFKETYTLEIFDMMNKLIYNSKCSSDNNIINLNNIERGVYIVSISNGTNKFSKKIVKL